MSQKLFGPNGFINYQEDDAANVTISWAGNEYYSFNRNDRLAKNIGIATLSGISVYQKTIMTIFQAGRNTITRVQNIYKRQGLNGLIGYHQGPVGIEDELKQFVIDMYKKLKEERGYQNSILSLVKEKYEKGEFQTAVSRGKMQAILKEYRDDQEKQKREYEEKRRVLEAKRKEREEEEEEKYDYQIELIQDLEQEKEICVDRGGAAVGAVLLNELGIMKHIPEIEDDSENKFSPRELAATYVILNAAKLVTVEQDFKHLFSYEMGGIIGRVKLPSLGTYRSRIPKIVQRMDMREIIYETSREVRGLFPFSTTVYIDGHFMPYYGGSETLYGYNPQRRLAMHGREYYYVHDENGIPVYAEISDGYRDMRHFIRDIDAKLRDIYGVSEKELLEIFDRGGYSKEFCVGISGMIRFICWRSDAKVVPKEAEQAKWEEVMVRHQGNTIYERKKPQTYYAWERACKFKIEEREAVFREVWIKKGNLTSPALTNDFELPLGEVVKKLTRRWGAQENGMKKLKEHGIDKIHSYRKEEYTEEYFYGRGLEDAHIGVEHEVDNPQVKKINRKISTLLKKRRGISDRIVQLEGKTDGRSKRTLKEKRKELYNLNAQIKRLQAKRETLPKKVLLFEKIEKEGIQRLMDEKKLFFDWLKMAALWSRQRILEIVKPYYENLRDVEKYVDSILNSRTYVRKKGEVVYMKFPEQHSKKKEEILMHLCGELNKCRDINLGLRVNRMIFDVRGKD